MGATGVVLSAEQCSLVESFIFGASTMYDDGKRVASWKFQKKQAHVCFLGMFELIRRIFLVIFKCLWRNTVR